MQTLVINLKLCSVKVKLRQQIRKLLIWSKVCPKSASLPIFHSNIILDLYAEDDDDEQEGSENFQIEELTRGHYKLTMHVAQ